MRAKTICLVAISMLFIFLFCCEGGGQKTATTSKKAPQPTAGTAKAEGEAVPKAVGSPSAELTEEALEKKVEWVYDPTGKRDPFLRPRVKEARFEEDPRTAYNLDQMWVDGILWGGGVDTAHIILPNGKDIIVKVGDELGINHGRVKQITSEGIVVEEVYVDPTNPSEIHIIEKVMKLLGSVKKK